MLKIYNHRPDHLIIKVEVAACYIEIDNKVLFLQRAHHSKYEPEAWGVPAGKLEPNELPLDAAIRELYEETSIAIGSDMIQPIGTLYIEKPGGSYAYHMFKVTLPEQPTVRISPKEHINYIWATHDELKNMDLMLGAYEALLYYYKQK